MGSGRLKPGWTRVAFGDVVRLSTERASKPEAAGFDRYVGLEHLDPGELTIRRCGAVAAGTTFTSVFRPGQVLFGKRRAYLRKVAVPDFSGVCSGDIYVLESKDEEWLLPAFLPFVCQTEAFFQHAIGTSAGSLSPRTNWRSLAKYEFALPPLDEQRRLADALSAIEGLTESILTLSHAASRVIGRAAAHAFSSVRRHSVPMVRLDSLCTRKPQSGIYKSGQFRGSGVNIVKMGELFANDGIDDTTVTERIEVSARELDRYALTPNDLLFGRRSLVLEGAGRCVRVGTLRQPTVFESSVLRTTIDPRKVDPQFVFEWFRSPDGQQQIKRIVTFTTVSGVSGSDVARLEVPLPSLAVQGNIAERLSRLLEAIGDPRPRLAGCHKLASIIRNGMLELS